MAAINYAHVGFTSDATVTDSTTLAAVSNTLISSSNFVANNRYLLIWRYQTDITNSGAQEIATEWRWATSGAIAKTRHEKEEASLTAGRDILMSGAALITSPASVEDLQLYAGRANQTGGTIVINDFKAVVIDLDDLTENTDWYHAEDDDTGASTNTASTFDSPADFATLTKTFASGDWLILPYAVSDNANSGASARIQLDYSGGGLTAGQHSYHELEGEDSNADYHGNMLVPRVFNLDGTSATFKVQMQSSSGSAAHVLHRYSSIIAINLDVFEEWHNDFTASEFEPSSASTYEEAAGITPFTPTTAGDFLVLGGGVQGGDADANTRVQVGGASLDQANEGDTLATWDARDTNIFINVGMDSFSGSTDIDLDFKTDTTGDGILDRSLIAISMELAGSGSGNTITANQTESGDTTSADLDVLVQLDPDQTEVGDTTSAALQALIQLAANQSETGDTQAASLVGVAVANITATQTETGDTVSAALNVIVQVSGNQTEEGDSTAADLDVIVQLVAAQTESGDTQSAFISTQQTAVITAAQTEDGDSTTAALQALIQLSGSQTEEGDSSAAALQVLVQIAANQTETGDTQAASLVESITLQVTCTLVNRFGSNQTNLTNLSWAWFDASDPVNFNAPSDKGETETTDGSGEIVIPLTNTTLSDGQVGTLVLRNDAGTIIGAYNLAVAEAA